MRKKARTRVLSLLLALIVVLGLLPGAAWAAGGTQAIRSAQDFSVMEPDGSYILMEDIEIATPYGDPSQKFTGTFDGNGHTITLDLSGTSNLGAFAYIGPGGVVKNLVTSGQVTASASQSKAGGIAGTCEGRILNCGNTASLTGKQRVGGIVGHLGSPSSPGKITNCFNAGAVSSTASKTCATGGIAGYVQNSDSVISNCCNSGSVTAKTQAGAIAGYCSGTVENCRWDAARPAINQAAGSIEDGKDSTSSGYDSAADAIVALNAGRGDGASWKLGDNGDPVLDLQSASEIDTTPKLTLDRDTAELYVNGKKDSITLTAKTENIPDEATITWASDNEKAVTLERIADNRCILVKASQGGTATVTAEVTVGEETLTASSTITVWPFVTTVAIDGTVAAGQTVKARINVSGGGELDYETFPVTVQWKYLTGEDYSAGNTGPTSYRNIAGATGREFMIPEDLEGNYLSFTYHYQNEDKSPGSPTLVKPAGTVDPDLPPSEPDKTLEEVLKGYAMHPICGTDTNVNRVLEGHLTEKGFDGFTAAVKSVREVYGGAGVASNGDITYFYADPDTTPTVRFGSYRVTFTLSKDGQSLEQEIPVIIYWDKDRVEAVMTQEILARVSGPAGEVTGELSLPKVVDNKRWTLASWESSAPEVISVSSENQSTADTLFDPYTAVVRRGTEEREVTLTAKFTFQLANDVIGSEEPVVLYKTFRVTVPAMDVSQTETIHRGLQAKLDAGFAKEGLTDAVTGEKLTSDENDVYTASNDIQLPTTQDFGVDGKYYPVTITTSDDAVLKAPDVNNAARVAVYRPGADQEGAEGTITVTLHDRDTSVTASRTFRVKVPALTREEIDTELALMKRVKASYFEGIKGENDTKDNVRTDLSPFLEVYERGGELVWVRKGSDRTGRGIVPVPIEGWEDLELWRLFKSSDPKVISHENLLVTRQTEAKAVTITSRLSSETLGRYGELYVKDPGKYPQYRELAPLYCQEVSTDTSTRPEGRRMARTAAQSQTDTIVVRGTRDPGSAVPVVEPVNNVTFSLTGLDGAVWIAPTSLAGLDESSTVYDVFVKLLGRDYTATRVKGTYIKAISGPNGSLAEKDHGENSGWMYRVNGRIPDVYMGACPLRSGDVIQVFYTRDAKKDDPNWNWPTGGNSGSVSGSPSSGTAEQTNAVSVEKSGSADTYIVTLPEDSTGPRLVTIPDVKAGQLVVIVHSDGREEVIKKSVLENDRAKFLLEQSATVRVIDYARTFGDVDDSAWYSSAVDFVSGRELFSGIGRDVFAPDLALSRGMLAAVLYRLEEPDAQNTEALFSDVTGGSWYGQGVAWAAETGIVSGYGDGRFGPDDSITREQLAAMLFRYAQLLNMSTGGRDSLTGFSDAPSVSPWAQDAVAWAVDSGIISGLPDGTLAPAGTATRAEAAAMLQRFVSVLLR